MKRSRWSFAQWNPRWLAQTGLLSAAFAFSQTACPARAHAEDALSRIFATVSDTSQPSFQLTSVAEDLACSPIAPFTACADPCAPCWCDPVCRVPNFFGDYFGVASTVNTRTLPRPLQYTGTGAEGDGFSIIVAPLTVNGPGGPFQLNDDIPINNIPDFTLDENPELSAQVVTVFPGATFINGAGTVDFQTDIADFFYNYLDAGGSVAVNLPNPSGGGLVGRNRYFENGSPIPHDRLYFTYTRVGDVLGLATPFDVNRYLFGAEKTFFNGLASVDLRVPFAGTADSDQIGGTLGTATATEFGNVGVLLKGMLYRTPNFVATAGLGLSLPTASDSRMLVAGSPIVEIENRAIILQPVVGAVWAPNDRFYAQSGLQFDFDSQGNPVNWAGGPGGLSQIGVLNDQDYLYFDNAVGYWLYANHSGCGLTGLGVQSELHYAQSFGSVDQVGNVLVNVADANSSLDVLNGTSGLIFRFAEQTNVSLGVSYPLAGDRYYDWAAQLQVNYQFGR
jgi:hypothetical protein